MTTQNVPAKLRKLASAAGIALGLYAAVAASVIVAAPQVSASATFVDHGGRVLSAARVYPIYWGPYWAPGRTASPTPDEITHALRTVLASSYLGGLTQYRAIGPATIHGSRVITTTDPPNRFTDETIEAFLNALFDAGLLPQDEQAIYVVTIPPGIDSTEIERVGEHNDYQRGGQRVHYAWITDSVALEGATQTTTHEIVETLTDPESTAILGNPGTCAEPGWCEIADICSDAAKLHGVMVAPYWSNIAGHCVIPAPPAYATSDHRLPGFTASRSGSALAIPADSISTRLRTADERRNRAAKRRSRNRRATRAGTARRGGAINLPPVRALHREPIWPSSEGHIGGNSPQSRIEETRRELDNAYRGDPAHEFTSRIVIWHAYPPNAVSLSLRRRVPNRSHRPTLQCSSSWDKHQHPRAYLSGQLCARAPHPMDTSRAQRDATAPATRKTRWLLLIPGLGSRIKNGVRRLPHKRRIGDAQQTTAIPAGCDHA
jgi:hypothetical protein